MDVVRILWAFVRRDYLTARSYRLAWVLGIADSVFQLAMFHYLSRMVEFPEVALGASREIDYFSFVVIGLALNTFLMTGIDLFSSSLESEQASGTLEVLFSLPTRPTLTLFGMGSFDLGWSFMTTSILMGLAVVIFGVQLVARPLALLAAACTLMLSLALYASLGIAIAACTLVFKRANALNGIIIQSLALLSGVYFPVDLLPQPVQWVSRVLPFAWTLDNLRRTLLLGEVSPMRLALLAAASVLMVPAALWLFGRALDLARRHGSLAQY